MDSQQKKRILILGGGFAGLDTALELEKIFARDDRIEIILINDVNYLVFTSMLAEVVASSIDSKHVVIPLRECLKKASFRELEVRAIDLEKRTVSCVHPGGDGSEEEPFEIGYDCLVLAVGSMTGYHGVPGAEEDAFPLKNLYDAMVLRSHVIEMFEHADLESDHSVRQKLLTFVVVGGGYTGIEVAAELSDFLDSSRRFYKNVAADEVKVVVIDPGTRILHEMVPDLAKYAEDLLRRRGMQFHLQTSVSRVDRDYVELKGAERIPTYTAIWAAGTAPQPVIANLPCRLNRGHIVVNEYLEVEGRPGVWALGDCAEIPDAHGGTYPPTAQHAIREGRRAASNIAAYLGGQSYERQPFRFETLGMLAPLGHRRAVAQIKGFKFHGFIAWLMWRAIYLGKLPGLDRKLRVALDWALDMVLPRDMVQLKFLIKPKPRRP